LLFNKRADALNIIEKKNEGGVDMKKMRVISISLSDDEIEMYQRLARQENKNFSDFIRKKVKQAVTGELKEAN
jgi:hypothetical protein